MTDGQALILFAIILPLALTALVGLVAEQIERRWRNGRENAAGDLHSRGADLLGEGGDSMAQYGSSPWEESE